MVRIMEDLKNLSIEAERELARTFMGRIEWEMIAIGLTQFVAWIVCWILVVNGTLALWEGFLLSVFTTSFAYLPSHAGQHGHLSGKNKNLDCSWDVCHRKPMPSEFRKSDKRMQILNTSICFNKIGKSKFWYV